MNRKLTAIALVTAAVVTNASFTALSSIFNYPDVLKEPSRVSVWLIWLAVAVVRSARTPVAVPASRRTVNAGAR
jgi:hypothetical protein